MPTPILSDADAFAFTTLDGEVLELWGAAVGWSDTVETGVVEHQIVKRRGAIHQTVGAPPRRFEFRCVIRGKDVRARYVRICDVVTAEPEGRLTHPRFGDTAAVCHSISASEQPGDATDEITFSLKFSETGLREPPKPSPAAQAQKAKAQGALVASTSADLGSTLSTQGAAVATRSQGLLIAFAAAEAGTGTLLDADASLGALSTACLAIDANPNAPKALRSAAMLTLAQAIQARNSFLVGRPQLITFRLDSSESLGALCQRLYGGRARDAKAEILRLNRIARPYAMPAGTELLISDPTATEAR